MLNDLSRMRNTQSGFTLIEILIALALITLLAVAISAAFDGSRSRAQTLMSNMAELGTANIRLKNDTGCYVNKPAALFDNALTADVDTFCGRPIANTWNGPYITKQTANAAGELVLDRVTDGVTVGYASAAGGIGTRYWVTAAGVPEDILRQALVECNGSDDDTVDFDTNKCRADLAAGTFDVLFDETR
jgi:prepilin-type N-terminal cleavage/methylation domain-containing protein